MRNRKCSETAAIVSGCACLVLSCLVVYLLFYLALVSCEIVCMDLSEVERLDGVLAEGKRWHGCLLCIGEGEEVPYNLLVQGQW